MTERATSSFRNIPLKKLSTKTADHPFQNIFSNYLNAKIDFLFREMNAPVIKLVELAFCISEDFMIVDDVRFTIERAYYSDGTICLETGKYSILYLTNEDGTHTIDIFYNDKKIVSHAEDNYTLSSWMT